MKIANGVEMLEITANAMAGPTIIYPVVIWDKDDVVLVDTGYPGQLSKFQNAFELAGIPYSSLNRIVITHQDIDHIGCIASIVKDLQGKVEVIAHEAEKPYITGEKVPVKLAQFEGMRDQMTEEKRAFFDKFRAGFEASRADVDRTVTDGEELPFCGGISVIHTPGHTPGHICLYHRLSKTLITGDAMTIEGGELCGPEPRIAFDYSEAIKSLEKVKQLDIENVICYHGGLHKGDTSQAKVK